MARRFYELPSLTGLNTFDACARHGSFTAAARELGVTLGAVSRQIKALEGELNCRLFVRLQRGVELTSDGRELAQVLTASLRQIGRVCRVLKTRGQSLDVTVAATTAFASLWLMPRLGGFWQRHREININHAISDNPVDPGFVNADLRVRYGDGGWRGEHSVKLFDDTIYPVCGVEFARRHTIERPLQLQGLTLLSLDGVDPVWTGWDSWFEQLHCDPAGASFRRFNNYIVALQAAEDNQGVALGWHSMVAPLIEQGRLVRLGDWQIAAPGSYFLTWDEQRPLSNAARLLSEWLQQQGREPLR